MMAWGEDASSWDDSVDYANIEICNSDEIPDDDFVVTTWHDKESLEDTFWFCGHAATHPTLELTKTYLVHVALKSGAAELLKTFCAANEETA